MKPNKNITDKMAKSRLAFTWQYGRFFH